MRTRCSASSSMRPKNLENLFIALLAGEEFLFDDSRGLNSLLEALRLRLTDDVYDRNRANPFGPMLRISVTDTLADIHVP